MVLPSAILTTLGNAASKTAGFAREELVLGTMVVGGLSTFGVMAGVPWDAWMTSDQVQAAALYEEIESANLKFFQEYGYWPHEVTDGSAEANIAVLVDKDAATNLYISPTRFRPLLEADWNQVDGKVVVRHRYGEGGQVREVALDEDDRGYRYVITLDNLSLKQARELDETVDGKFDPENGRLLITYLGSKAIARYFANPKLEGVASM